MNKFHLFDLVPLWLVYILIVSLILLSAWAGVAFVQARMKKRDLREDGPINTIVGANLILLAFILSFIFGLASTRYDARRFYLLQEVNSIETTFLRANFLPNPQQTEVRELLKEYVRLRVELSKDFKKAEKMISNSYIIQRKIWSIATEVIDQSPRDDQYIALFVESLNNMFDNQTNRVTIALNDRIPTIVWISLFVLIMLSMFSVGYMFGKSKKPNWYIIFGLSLAFSAIILVIIDFDSIQGTIKISHQPVFNLYEKIKYK